MFGGSIESADQGSIFDSDTFKDVHDQSAVIVLTPRCDLVRDNGRTRKAERVTLAAVVPLDVLAKTRWPNAADRADHVRNVIDGKEFRWYFLAPFDRFTVGAVVDFETVTSAGVALLDKVKPIVTLEPVYREHLAHHYAMYAGRVGIDEIIPNGNERKPYAAALIRQIDTSAYTPPTLSESPGAESSPEAP